ncbi:MAG: hypothetical protein ACI4PO_02360 [Faecousia sp.]
MAKVIKYRFLSSEINHGTEENPVMEQIIFDKTMLWSEANEEIAKREAYNGEYTIEDDGQPESESEASTQERISNLEEAMELFLSGVTE